jgi:hypothetical protein
LFETRIPVKIPGHHIVTNVLRCVRTAISLHTRPVGQWRKQLQVLLGFLRNIKRFTPMKKVTTSFVLAAALGLAACSGADNAETGTEEVVEGTEATAEEAADDAMDAAEGAADAMGDAAAEATAEVDAAADAAVAEVEAAADKAAE